LFIEAKDDGGGGDNWSYKWCKAVWFSLTKTKTKITRNGKITIPLTKT